LDECLFVTKNMVFCRSVMVLSPSMFQISRNNRRVCQQHYMNFFLKCSFSVNDLSKLFNFFHMRLHPSQWGSYFFSLQKSGVLVWIRRYNDTKLLFGQIDKRWLLFLLLVWFSIWNQRLNFIEILKPITNACYFKLF